MQIAFRMAALASTRLAIQVVGRKTVMRQAYTVVQPAEHRLLAVTVIQKFSLLSRGGWRRGSRMGGGSGLCGRGRRLGSGGVPEPGGLGTGVPGGAG